MAGAHIFQNSARTVYSSNLTDIQERTRGTTALTGGYYSALLNVVVIVVVPLLGVFFDKVGWRMPFVSIGAAIYVVAFALIGLTKVNAIAPILLASFGLSLNVLPWIASFPILVPDPTLIGTAYGLFSSLIACNNVILEVACGAIVSPVLPKYLGFEERLELTPVARRHPRPDVRPRHLPPDCDQGVAGARGPRI